MAVAHKGSISMGLVLIPIGMYKATVDNDIHFNQLEKESKARITYKKYCSLRAINRVAKNDGDFIGAFRQNVMHVIGSYGKTEEDEKYDELIREKEKQMVALIEEYARNGTYGEAGDEAFKKIADEINELKDRQLEERHRKQLAENYEQRIADMDEFLKENTVKLVEYDDELVRRIVSRIHVLSVDRIQMHLKSGIILEEELR